MDATSYMSGSSPPTTGARSAGAFPGLRPPGTAGDSRLTEAQRSFEGVLGRAFTVPGAADVTKEQKARESAEQLVAVAFLQPMLKELRDTNHAAAPFAPTSAEKQFRSLMDAELAQRITKASRLPIVDAVTRKLLAGREGASAETGAPGADAARAAATAFPLTPERSTGRAPAF